MDVGAGSVPMDAGQFYQPITWTNSLHLQRGRLRSGSGKRAFTQRDRALDAAPGQRVCAWRRGGGTGGIGPGLEHAAVGLEPRAGGRGTLFPLRSGGAL